MIRRRGQEPPRPGVLVVLAAAAALAALAGCDQVNNMYEQPRLNPLAASAFFADSSAARRPPAGTIARRLPGDRRALTAAESLLVRAAEPRASFSGRPAPRPITPALLARGRERFGIFCAPCHGDDGYGDGTVVRRGFPRPPSFHSRRLRRMRDTDVFDVITGGRGKMPPYGPHVPEADRWAIIAYLRALQLSQHAELADAPDSARTRLLRARSAGGGTP